MSDRVVEVSSRSWGSRLVESIKGVLFGIVLFLAAFPLLWWNEGRALRTAKSLEEGQSAAVAVASDKVDAANEGKLVHVSGTASTPETLQDNAFGLAVQALRLQRDVEMFQWVEDKKTETRKKVGGGEEVVTTYSYDRKWKSSVVRSDDFHERAGHQNPPSMLFENADIPARNATLGAFHLTEKIVGKIGGAQPHRLGAEAAAKLPTNLTGRARVIDGGVYVGSDPQNAQVGDLRITWRQTPSQVVSIVGLQAANSFKPWKASAGDEVLLVQSGSHTVKEMFATAQEQNSKLTWILRLVGYLMMAVGLMLILRPIVVVADFIPMIGNFAGFSATVFGLVAAFPIAALVIAVSWIAVRPLIGIAVLLAALLGFAALIAVAVMAWKKRHRRA